MGGANDMKVLQKDSLLLPISEKSNMALYFIVNTFWGLSEISYETWEGNIILHELVVNIKTQLIHKWLKY